VFCRLSKPERKQFTGVIDAIGVMRQLVKREQGVADTLRNEIEDALSTRDIDKFEEENRTWVKICDLIHQGTVKDTGTYDPLTVKLAEKLGVDIEDIRPVFEEFRESFRSSIHFRRMQEAGKSPERRDLLQKSRETFDECMVQIYKNHIFPISEEALLYIYENITEPKEREYVLILYGLETTIRIVDQIVYQCVTDGDLPEFDTSHHIVSLESSYGIFVNDISLTLAIHFHPSLRIGNIFRIQAEHMPRYSFRISGSL